MPAAPFPPHEAERLAALNRYGILDTLDETEFDDFTRLASEICGTPIALISLVDAHRQWFKSKVGLDASETSREQSFCAHAILGMELLEVPNALEDKRFADNPLVLGAPDIRFYAGMPLTNSEGLNMGSLCVIDRVPRHLTDRQRELLAALGRQVMAQMELRLAKRQLQQQIDLHKTTETRLQAVLDAATHVSIVAGTTEGLITMFNPGAERMLGYSAAEMVGKQTPAIFHLASEIKARSIELTRQTGKPVEGMEVFFEQARRGTPEEREWTYVRKDGSHLTVNLVVTASRSATGEITGYLGIAMDVTARRKMEATLKQQSRILDLANDTIFTRDGEDRITYWNQGAERVYGWTKEEAMGQVTHSLLATQFPQPLESISAQLFAAGHWQGELQHVRRNGEIVIVASSWTLQRDAFNRPISVIEMNHDITDRKKAEVELSESREVLNTILESSLDGVIAYEAIRDENRVLRDLRFTLINRTAERLLRQDASTLLGKRLLEKFPNAASDGLFQNFSDIVEKGLNREFEYVSTRSETPRWYRIAGVRLGDGLVISYMEITARKEYERQLEEAKERAEFADRAKSDFLANMSHEIRTPMNGVIGMTGLLLDTRLDTQQRGLAETVRSSAESLLSLINDILDFSKIEAGKLHFDEHDFSVRKVVEDCLEIMAAQAQAKGIELIADWEPELITNLRGDSGRVQQVLMNLVSNAVKFTASGDVTIHVLPESQSDTDVVLRFEIQDSGIGIPPETQARLFQPFVQADGSTSRQYGGTGLGLAICKRLAESMDGTIGVRSSSGKGSTFWVTMKFKRQAHPEIDLTDVIDFTNTHVLIVDGNESIQRAFQKQLGARKMRIDGASTGEEALEVLRKAKTANDPYTVAIIDLRLPDMNASALVQAINHDAKLNATRLILLTPFGKSIPADDLKAMGIAASCGKPVRQAALLECLAEAVAEPKTDFAPQQTQPLIRATGPLRLHKQRVLLAEDNVVNQQVALGNLQKLGYTADLATNGIEVLEALEKKQYDMILMDCQMPELDGYQVTREIRLREKKGHRTWIIAMTANVMVGDRERCLAAGMDDYVSKPLRRENLRAALDRGAARPVKPPTNHFLKNLGDDENELAELIGLFIDSAPASITQLKLAAEKKNAADIAFAAHTLKGSCGNFGKSELYETCVQLEQAGRDGKLGDVAELVTKAEMELSFLIETLRARVQNKPST
jgi:PAS domain S-box-containing protein